MKMLIACVFPFTGDKQAEITKGLEPFYRRYATEPQTTPGVLKMEVKLETVNEADGVTLLLVRTLTEANNGAKFVPSVKLERVIMLDPLEVH